MPTKILTSTMSPTSWHESNAVSKMDMPTSRQPSQERSVPGLTQHGSSSIIRLADWSIGHVLGQGHFGKVILARHVQSRKIVAWKRFPTQRIMTATQRGSRLLELLEREIRIHKSVNHPNILSFLGYAVDEEHVTLVLEYADKGDLFEYSNKYCDTDVDRVRLFHQVYPCILSAVSYLESLQIAHRDLKPENILLKTVHQDVNAARLSPLGTLNIQPLLCDFGWSVWYLKAGAQQSTLCGTPEYVPPELLSLDTPTTPRRYAAEFVDPWALGVLALEMLQGETPFGAPVDCPAADIRPTIYGKIRGFDRLDRALCHDLNQLAAAAVVVDGSLAAAPSMARVGQRGRDCGYVTMIQDFLQTTPCRRLSATECLTKYADLLGSTRLAPPPRPSVKQRRQIFQKHHHAKATLSSFKFVL